MTTLWHYTCDHGHDLIGTQGRLISARTQLDPSKYADLPPWQVEIMSLIWLTDLDTPQRDALGLTSETLGCDRTRHRYRIVGNSRPSHYPTIRRGLSPEARASLERVPGAMPMHWWISRSAVPVVYDPLQVTVSITAEEDPT